MPNLTSEELWSGLCDSLNQVTTIQDSNEAFNNALGKILCTLSTEHRAVVESELRTIAQRGREDVSALTAEVGLLALLYTLRTTGLAVDDGRINSQLEPPDLHQIDYDLAERLLINDPTAALEIEYQQPVVINEFSDEPEFQGP